MVGGAKGSFIGPIHRMAVRMDDLADLVAGCFSRDSRKNKATSSRYHLDASRVYPDWRRLIAAEKDKIDFVTICTTNESHYPIARAALLANLDVFCEKPLSLTVREAKTLARLAAKKKRVLGIPFTYLGYPSIKLARDLVRQGDLGRIDKVVIEYLQGSFRKQNFSQAMLSSRNWKMNPQIAGPSCVLADIGVHAFSLIEYVTGLEAETLLADLSSFAQGNCLDDDASVLLRFKGGAKASLVASKIATGEENSIRLRVYGTKASLFWEHETGNQVMVKTPVGQTIIYTRNSEAMNMRSPLAHSSTRFPAGHPEGFVEAMANLYDEFVTSVLTRKKSDCPGPCEGVRSIRFVEAALKSAHRGCKWTKI